MIGREGLTLNPIDDLTVFISRDGAELFTDTRAVALAFRKRHADVMRIVNRIRASRHTEVSEHYQRNFASVEFVDAKGELRPMYRMTAKGLSELAMSFTGEPARIIRIRFLNAFEEMAARLERAEWSIAERLFDLERRELPSKIKGQVGSRLMNDRRREKPVLAEERAALEALAQPVLPGLVQAPALVVVDRKRPAGNDARKKRRA